MKQRVFDKMDSDYQHYGGRGIILCKRWLDFQNFKEDMYKSYLAHVAKFSEKNTSIDRIDNNKGYNPKNCRWATRVEQNRNKRNNRKYNGECAAEASRRLGGGRSLVKQRLRNGWSEYDAYNRKIYERVR